MDGRTTASSSTPIPCCRETRTGKSIFGGRVAARFNRSPAEFGAGHVAPLLTARNIHRCAPVPSPVERNQFVTSGHTGTTSDNTLATPPFLVPPFLLSSGGGSGGDNDDGGGQGRPRRGNATAPRRPFARNSIKVGKKLARACASCGSSEKKNKPKHVMCAKKYLVMIKALLTLDEMSGVFDKPADIICCHFDIICHRNVVKNVILK